MVDYPATDAQIKNLLYRARLNGVTKQEVETESFRRWGRGVYNLTRPEATALTGWVNSGGEEQDDDD